MYNKKDEELGIWSEFAEEGLNEENDTKNEKG